MSPKEKGLGLDIQVARVVQPGSGKKEDLKP